MHFWPTTTPSWSKMGLDLGAEMYPRAGFLLAICPKTQGRKNSNSRKISQKLKEFFPRKLKKPPNRGKFWVNFNQKLKFEAKNRHF